MYQVYIARSVSLFALYHAQWRTVYSQSISANEQTFQRDDKTHQPSRVPLLIVPTSLTATLHRTLSDTKDCWHAPFTEPGCRIVILTLKPREISDVRRRASGTQALYDALQVPLACRSALNGIYRWYVERVVDRLVCDGTGMALVVVVVGMTSRLVAKERTPRTRQDDNSQTNIQEQDRNCVSGMEIYGRSRYNSRIP